jgi:hypothetical protein
MEIGTVSKDDTKRDRYVTMSREEEYLGQFQKIRTFKA